GDLGGELPHGCEAQPCNRCCHLRFSLVRDPSNHVLESLDLLIEAHVLLDFAALGKKLTEVPLLWVHPRVELLNALLQRQCTSTRRSNRRTKNPGSRIQVLDRHAEVIQKALGLPSLGVDGDAKAGRISLAVQVEMLTGRFRAAEDTGPSPEVAEQ